METRVKTTRSKTKEKSKKSGKTGKRGAAKLHHGGLGFHPVDFSTENRIVRDGWTTTCTSSGGESVRLLTDRAKSIIQKATSQGEYRTRTDKLKPPFMALSVDPDDYPLWCSYCNDFAETGVLCVGCRSIACVATTDHPTGCLKWSPAIEDPTFVFRCFHCKNKKEAMVLTMLRDPPKKENIFFRMNSPVLIISATWHEITVLYGQYLHNGLIRRYVGFEDSIMLLEVALDVAADEFKDINYDDTVETTYSSEAAEEFLKEFPTAKIVVVIDTHSAESGFLLWKGKPRGDFETTPLLPILSDCVPAAIFQYLSDEDEAPDHSHRIMIVNLSCGSSIIKDEARHSLLKGHCADAVVSFATPSTQGGDVCDVLTLGARTQLPGGYMPNTLW